ncbi:hypothetical protein T492DRAFT_1110339 [Pavlovales sp. CCMP2436]|nr:hypothetical protein T492DRAFT_1110339 [Pavlovales sp. CCMP2436]
MQLVLCKPAKHEVLGLVFAKSAANALDGALFIARLREGSIASSAGLEVGDRILTIRGRSYTDAHEAVLVLRKAEGTLEIVIAPRSSTGDGLEGFTDRLYEGLTRALSFGRRPAAEQAQPPKPSFHAQDFFAALGRSAEEGFTSALSTAREVAEEVLVMYDKVSGQHRVKAAICIQARARVFLALLEARTLHSSALIIQARARGLSARRRQAKAKAAVVILQCGARGLLLRSSLRAERLKQQGDIKKQPKQSRIRRTFSFFGKGRDATQAKSERAPLAAVRVNPAVVPPAAAGKQLATRSSSFGFGRRSTVHS